MKTTHLYIAGIILTIGASACNGNASTGSSNPGDSTTTTTTTTTTTVRHAYHGAFIPQTTVKYIDLRTSKQISVKIDTIQGDIVNDETNQPVDLFVEPMTHDTIYGMTGAVVNNFIIHDSTGDFRLDTARYNTMQPPADNSSTTIVDDATGKAKYKEKANGKVKYKDDEEKVKAKNGKETDTYK